MEKEFIKLDKNATIIALQETGDVVEKFAVPEKEARTWIRNHGYVTLDVEKTATGETMIWVA